MQYTKDWNRKLMLGITIAASFHRFHNICLNLDNIFDTALAT